MPRSMVLFRPDIVEVTDNNGVDWWEVPAVENISKTGGEGSQTQIRAINGTAALAEPPGVPTWAVTLAAYAPHVKAIDIVEDYATSGNTLEYRLRTKPGTELLAESSETPANTQPAGIRVVTIDGDGIVTFAEGTSATNVPDFLTETYSRLGLILQTGHGTNNGTKTNYVISKIDEAVNGTGDRGAQITVTDLDGNAPDAVAAPGRVYSIRIPSLAERGTATVSAAGNYEGNPSGPLTGGFTLVPDARHRISVAA